MSEPFVAEVRIWALNFAPRGWAFCNGQILPIAQNTALFSLVGTTYGGDGRTTFGLPNLQGRAAMHPGRGPGLTARRLGEVGGNDTITLTEAQVPSHNHTERAFGSLPNDTIPTNNILSRTTINIFSDPGNLQQMNAESLATTGGSQAHNNMQPSLVLNFCIALVGIYPSRS